MKTSGSVPSCPTTTTTPSSTTSAAEPIRAAPGRRCSLCPRLRALFAPQTGLERGWFNAPVPSFGAPAARLVVVGLAPGLRGANRTGRPFTGDFAGEVLYPTLWRHGFAKGTYAADPEDGFELVDCRIANALRCVPPAHPPPPAEIATCRRFLIDEVGGDAGPRAILALGRIAHES